MKKTLIALAALGAFASVAQAQSVTLYGVADVGIVAEDNGVAGSVTRMDSGGLNGSRWGLKGSEDLGGGLNAIFTLESGFNLDAGSSAQGGLLFGRQSWVGLNSGANTLKMGRIKNPIYDTSDVYDPFGDSQAGDTARLINYQGSRTNNNVVYEYSASGLTVSLQYGLGEVAGNNSKSSTVAGYVKYANGPVGVVLTSETQRDATDTYNTQVTLLGGNYDFKVAKLFLAVASEQGQAAAAGRDQTDALVGATVPVGTAGTLELSYLKKTDNKVNNANATQTAIGYLHPMSKRTTLYTSYGVITSDSGFAYAQSGAAQTITGGKDYSMFSMGIKHSF